ncbi:tryptophan synthase subunit beta like protein [Oceanimonas smirnovii]|uniref:Tryptophan synthase subunit beta like protein n=1 Tax=Oceanimonas smirnovii TaxID=264574 RepID=A0ABW7P4X3_9GAMM
MFVKRDKDGRICAVSREQIADISEPVEDQSPELARFINASAEPGSDPLKASDLAMSRVLEDLIDLLIDKQLIQFTELPSMAQQKLLTRQSLRKQYRLDLFSDHDNDDDEQIPMI